LESHNIKVGPKDQIIPAFSSQLYNKEVIKIKRAMRVTLEVDDKIKTIQSSGKNVKDFLKEEGISLGKEDTVEPRVDTLLYEGMKIKVKRVMTYMYTDCTKVDFNTVVKYDRSVSNTTRETIRDGQFGESQLTMNYRYEDGSQVLEQIVSENITTKPKEKIILQGTYPVMPISHDGVPVPYSTVYQVKCTAYHAINGIGRTYTNSGRKAVRNPDGYSTIAVDTNLIPLGTKLFVQGYGFAIAADTGSAIKGKIIDVFFDTLGEVNSWGVKYENLYVLK
jgi:3D (Asp-Asp-Asp) domain-containing protein